MRQSQSRIWRKHFNSQATALCGVDNVTNATDDRDQQAEVVEDAQQAVDDKQDEVDSAWGTLQQESTDLSLAQGALEAADEEVTASIVTITGTGTGSAQVVGLDSDDLIALGEGTVVVSSVATDPAGNADSDGTGFTLDTIVPDAPSIDSWATDTNITDDGVTYDNTLTVSVTGEREAPRGSTSAVHMSSLTARRITPGPRTRLALPIITDELAHEFAGGLTATITDTAGNESDHLTRSRSRSIRSLRRSLSSCRWSRTPTSPTMVLRTKHPDSDRRGRVRRGPDLVPGRHRDCTRLGC